MSNHWHGEEVGSRIKNPSWGRVIRRIGKLVREISVSTRGGLFVSTYHGFTKFISNIYEKTYLVDCVGDNYFPFDNNWRFYRLLINP